MSVRFWPILLGIASGLLATWLVLVAVLWRAGSDRVRLTAALRLLPDLLRLLRALAGDATLPRAVRWRLWLLLAYLACPVDLIPDFLPVIGYADDAAMAILALRSVVRRAGRPALERHWPGTAEGLATVCRLAGLR